MERTHSPAIDFISEAQASLGEVSFALKRGELSESLPCSSQCAFINLTTLEGREFCVRLNCSGFKVLADMHT